ncbi:MAG: 1-acyl-sn-glycerol-3-phosphate acyltransferase [Halochromatium sp.]|nr:1-acyl-sn-glycerol-3-phosphate acyltransferase [Halochromatium sp.]
MSANQTLRSVAFEVFLWLSILVYSTLLLTLARVLSPLRLQAIVRHWDITVLWALRWICGLRYRVSGDEHLQQGRAQIILSNHQSTWETIALGALLPAPQTWVMKRELLRIPFFGWALRLFDPIAIERSANRKALRQLLSVGAKRLALGHRVVIFPEGTRVAPGTQRPFSLGGAMLAARTGVPVVPIAHNAGYFWGRNQLRKRPGTIDILIGPPIETKGLNAAAINALAEDWIQSTAKALAKNARS